MLEIYNICFYVHIDKTDDLYDVLTEFGFYMSPNTLKWQNQMWRYIYYCHDVAVGIF